MKAEIAIRSILPKHASLALSPFLYAFIVTFSVHVGRCHPFCRALPSPPPYSACTPATTSITDTLHHPLLFCRPSCLCHLELIPVSLKDLALALSSWRSDPVRRLPV
ncbi:hypothetical protein BO82DRAFT_125151 [Aspergillus uvarum CBS 121591]|uniref:Uncharacterized protein n=1 Tax=Aspergillus uvarum CBS 121591 TaxID=1448315 RepID=A0A319CWA7_9EURO|nr:hypothetical protein BO82DRAFT_125151 [Aspergillus uvarum CBS 121591]PYH79878.1 hypothetical protein BO82DRAFT_125151 [Aspergillus uvarum CBS 121591]